MDSWSDMLQRQPALNEQDMMLREQFVHEYLRHGDEVEAILALGYMPTTAKHMAKQFLLDTYVVRRVQELSELIVPADTIEARVTSTIMKLTRSPNENARIVGCRLGIDYLKLKSATKSGETVVSSGVMLVPYLESEDAWQQSAMAQQKQLMSEARG